MKLMSGNFFSDISDHFPNFMLLVNDKKRLKYNERPNIRLFTCKKKEKFGALLESIRWDKILYCKKDVNVGYDTFLSEIKRCYECCFPLTRLSRRGCRDKKWITKGLKVCSRRKNKLFKKWCATGKIVDQDKYLEYKKVYGKVAKQAETDYYDSEFDYKTNNIKQIWHNLNKLCSTKNKKAKSPTIITTLNYKEKEISTPADIANAMNEYFCTVGTDLVKKLPDRSVSYTKYLKSPIKNSIYCEPVTVLEVTNLINSLNVTKSSGPDNISPLLVKENCLFLCEPLAYLFNLSLEKGIVPSNLKTAKVVPIFKKGDVHTASNYRPISLLSIFNKLLERLVYKRMYNFLNKNQTLYEFQFGFRKNHSTSLALLEVVDNCYKQLDENNIILGIYLDLQKAFDTVDHSILLHKLYYYGIRGTTYDWLKSYLCNREQYTVVNNHQSSNGRVICGVPQGSVLGPLLFLIYVNDISQAVPGNKLKLFADDTNLFLYGKTLVDLENQANSCLSQLDLWFVANRLSLNIEKTCYTLFSPRNIPDSNCLLNITINNQPISKVTNCKYLGIVIDEKLKWDAHIESLYKKLIKYTGIFYKIRNVLPRSCLRKLYYALVHPHILYGIEIYANTSDSLLDKLYKLNNKILRILQFGKKETHVCDMYNVYNTLQIPHLRELQLLLFMHKYFYHRTSLPSVFHSYFMDNEEVHEHNTRQKKDLHIALVNSSFGQKCTAYCGSKMWNRLPDDIKAISSLTVFKIKVKKYLANRIS